jgi:hypothetical protein
MKERNPSRCIFHAYSATSATFISQVEIKTPIYIYLVFSPRLIYENVDNVFIEISYPEVFKETLISFNNEQLRHRKRDAIRFGAMGNVDQTFCPKLLSTKQTFDLLFSHFCYIKS